MVTQSPGLVKRLAQGCLVKQILVGLVLGIALALVSKPAAIAAGLFGTLLVMASIAVGTDWLHARRGIDRKSTIGLVQKFAVTRIHWYLLTCVRVALPPSSPLALR